MFSDGVLIMELVVDAQGHAAPRLNDIQLSAERAREYHAVMLNQTVRMLCAGLIHGDLSEYNVLVGADGPVIIDFPQAVDAAGNQNAKRMLLRDVDNLRSYFGRFARELMGTSYGKEIWKLYERGELHPETELTGLVEEETVEANVDGVLQDIEDAREAHYRRFGRKVVDIAPSAPPSRAKRPRAGGSDPQPRGASANDQGGGPKKRRRRRRKPANGGVSPSVASQPSSGQPRPHVASAEANTQNAPPRKRRRRRRKPQSGASPQVTDSRQHDAQATPGAQPGAASSPPKRRRRRRRRKPASPPVSPTRSSQA